jgi:hypothetical protein
MNSTVFPDEVPMSAPATPNRTAVAAPGLAGDSTGVVRAIGVFGEILAVAYVVPLGILAIGVPVALLVRLVMWIVPGL